MKKLIAAILIIIALSACATARKTQKLSLGMTKAEVIKILGKPTSAGADGNYEYLYFRLADKAHTFSANEYSFYYVKFKYGQVEGYGRGDK